MGFSAGLTEQFKSDYLNGIDQPADIYKLIAPVLTQNQSKIS